MNEDPALQAICKDMVNHRRALGVCEMCGQSPPTQKFQAGCFILKTCEPCMELFQERLLKPFPPVLSEAAVRHCISTI